MTTGNYYKHDFSPFIFTVKNFSQEGLAVAAIVLAFLSFAVLWLWPRLRSLSGTLRDRIEMARPWLIFSTIAAIVLLGLHKAGIDWGLRWYSTMYLLAYLFVYLCCRHWIGKRSIMLTPILLDTLIAYLMIGMLIGARAAYVFIYNWNVYSQSPLDALKIWEGGLSFHGGIVGVITAIVIFCRRHGISFWHLSDQLAFTVPVGIGLGRIGNFMNGELYGRVISDHVPWAMIFPTGGNLPRHPSQLYQSLGEGWLLFLTLIAVRRFKSREGTTGAAFVFFYGFYRFFMEFFREADEQLKYYFNNSLTMGQILCFITMLAGIGVFIYTRDNIVIGSEQWRQKIDAFLERRAKEEAA
jgi:phosphatidylglycerol:prolipoprotein diacylglycerol transferase